MKTLLITGINGFLGSHLAKTLQEKYDIIGLENSSKDLFRLNDYNFKVYSAGYGYEEIFKENKIFAILHTAVIYSTENTEVKNLINTNILLPVTLLEIANKYGCELFINTDSFFNNKNYNYSYLSEYILSKRQAIEWLSFIKGDCKLINAKLFHLYGPDDSPNKFVSQVISVLKNNEPTLDITPGEQQRDFIYVKDVVNAYELILEKHNLIENNDNIEVGTGKPITIIEFVNKVKELTNSSTKINTGVLPYRNNEIMFANANPEKLKSLGWNQRYSLSEGVLEIINHDSCQQK